ncbi:MAG TPA: phosphoglycerate dehydrogenase [Dehalococcoidia bacterium]|nr:phosphoglycerate dehydrogenase [Dehalococcoidia bacterium]
MPARILICDPIAEDGINLLRQFGAEVDVRTGLSPQELIAAVADYDALVVRSETKVTADVIAAASQLQVIGRAGIGVDNIDVKAASERGVVVVNAPTGNVSSAAEHTIALMLALARYIPQADETLRSGKWERGKFLGVEVRGRTMGIVGLGQVGSEVARRARGLEMRVLAYDPFVPEERARVLGVEVVGFDELLRQSDFITLHVTLTDATRKLIGEKEFKKMKPGARIINVSRGGVIDEKALLKALDEGRIAGAALDVFETEPVTDHPLFHSDKVVVTPHLGASTAEAQERVAMDVAEQIIAVLQNQPARWAVNAPLIAPETYSVLAPYIPVAQKTGSLAVQLCQGQLGEMEIDYSGDIAQYDVTPLKAAVVGGLLGPISEEHINVVNVDLVAQRRGLRITEKRSPSHNIYSNLISVRLKTSAGDTVVSGTLAHDGPHIVYIDDFWVDVPPIEGWLLTCVNRDQPGMIGAVGTLLGGFDVNISYMNVGREEKRGNALMVITIDESLTPEQLAAVEAIPSIYSVKLAKL